MMDLQKVNRREFLKTTGMVGGGLVLGINFPLVAGIDKESKTFMPNAFVHLAENGETTLYCGRCEMGQGISTALPAAVADEMEADWSMVKVLQGDGDKKYGPQATGGSVSVNTMYIPMRRAGAAAREMLVSAAAKNWGVSASNCYAKMHYVHNKKTGKKLAYGELASMAAKLEVPEEPVLKTKDQYRYIGQSLPRHDQGEVVVGKRIYGIDTRIPGLKYAAIQHVPVLGGTLKSLDKSDAMKMKGVIDVVEVERFENPFSSVGGVAVVADNTWTAQQALKKLKIEWDFGENAGYDSDEYMQGLIKAVENPAKPLYSGGDVDNAMKESDTTLSATYTGAHLSHSPMEPMASVAWVQDDSCEIWAATQAPQRIQEVIAKYLGRKDEDIVVHVTMAGGAFGRKGKCDYVHEAVVISKAVGAPVQLTWSREADTQTGYYHSINAQYLEAGLDETGNIYAWLLRAAFPSIGATFNPAVDRPSERDMRFLPEHAYGVPNYRIESGLARAHTRIGWYRAVYHIFYGFAINAFTDELAEKAGMDMVSFLHQTYDNNKNPELRKVVDRSRGVLDLVAEKGGWGRKVPENHGLGIAVHFSYNSYLAMLVHVETRDNKVIVHKVDCAVDCGQVLNPDIATAQMEGAVIMGLSLSLKEQINFKNGRVVNSNFHDYQVLRNNELPNEINVYFVDSDEDPTGLGEPGVPTFAPAFANAIYAASGKRYRSLPIRELSV